MGRLTDGQDVADFFMPAPEDAQSMALRCFQMLCIRSDKTPL